MEQSGWECLHTILGHTIMFIMFIVVVVVISCFGTVLLYKKRDSKKIAKNVHQDHAERLIRIKNTKEDACNYCFLMILKTDSEEKKDYWRSVIDCLKRMK